MFYERFCSLCESIHKKPTTVILELGISKASGTRWKNGAIPKEPALNKISQYFGVSIDYLLGKTDSKNETASIQAALFNGEQPPEEAWQEVERFIEFVKDKYGIK